MKSRRVMQIEIEEAALKKRNRSLSIESLVAFTERTSRTKR